MNVVPVIEGIVDPNDYSRLANFTTEMDIGEKYNSSEELLSYFRKSGRSHLSYIGKEITYLVNGEIVDLSKDELKKLVAGKDNLCNFDGQYHFLFDIYLAIGERITLSNYGITKKFDNRDGRDEKVVRVVVPVPQKNFQFKISGVSLNGDDQKTRYRFKIKPGTIV